MLRPRWRWWGSRVNRAAGSRSVNHSSRLACKNKFNDAARDSSELAAVLMSCSMRVPSRMANEGDGVDRTPP